MMIKISDAVYSFQCCKCDGKCDASAIISYWDSYWNFNDCLNLCVNFDDPDRPECKFFTFEEDRPEPGVGNVNFCFLYNDCPGLEFKDCLGSACTSGKFQSYIQGVLVDILMVSGTVNC